VTQVVPNFSIVSNIASVPILQRYTHAHKHALSRCIRYIKRSRLISQPYNLIAGNTHNVRFINLRTSYDLHKR